MLMYVYELHSIVLCAIVNKFMVECGVFRSTTGNMCFRNSSCLVYCEGTHISFVIRLKNKSMFSF